MEASPIDTLCKDKASCQVVFITIIAGRKGKDDLLTALHAAGLKMINTMYGKGTVEAGYIKNVLGLIPENNKIIITGLTPTENTGNIFGLLKRQFQFDNPNTGIAFTVPLEKLSF